MVRLCSRLPLLAALALLPASELSAKIWADYKIGDPVDADLIAPKPLVVIDAEATEALRQKQAQQIPAVLRLCSRTTDDAETNFLSAVAKTRASFLDTLEPVFRQRTLSAQNLSSSEFRQLVASFQEQNTLFPVTSLLAELWAAGESDDALVSPLTVRLREAMQAPICADALPAGIELGATVRLIAVAGTNEPVSLPFLDQHGFNQQRTNLVTLTSAKTALENSFPPEERATGKCLASFLRPNCVPDAELTRALRARATADTWVADCYQAGQVIARRGQIIDKKTKAAIDLLDRGTLLARIQQRLIDWIKLAPPTALLTGAATVWAAFLILITVIWKLKKRGASASLLPAVKARSADETALLPAGASEESWRTRALAAEQRAQQAQAVVRAGLWSHLARWMSDKLVQRLLWQHWHLLAAQQKAVEEMAELGERLEVVHARMHDRLQAYEQRIAELEKELEMKGKENHELIKAEINTIKRKLEIERAKGQVELN